MTETVLKPKEELAAVAKDQLPAVIDTNAMLKSAYLKDIYTGIPGFVIPLSQRFNGLVDEKSVSPDFKPLQKLGYKVGFKSWNPEKRSFHSDNAYDSKEGYYRSIIVYSEDGNLDLIEDPMLKGLQNTLLPMVADMQSDMEKQLDNEIKRLQKLQGRSPK